MARYRKIDPRIWNDKKFRELSDRAKLAFLFLLTHPHMTAVGAMRATMGGLADELKWTSEAFGEAFLEALAKGMVQFDVEASFVALPNFLKYNGPESPNVVKAWSGAFDVLPESPLRDLVIQRVSDFLKGLHPSFLKALPEDLSIAVSKAMPNQEQEQEQEQEPEPEPEPEPEQEEDQGLKASLPPSGGSGQIPNGHDLLGNALPPSKPKRRACPFEGVIGIYHEELCPPLPLCEMLTKKREGQIRQRWQEDLPELEHWRNFCQYVKQSDFLMGRKPGTGGRPPFRADIEWLTNATNFANIAEGKYHR